MKKLLFPLAISFALLAQTFAGSFGPGPWASGAYYPGATDGKYQASVTGNNISGVIGFSIREGSPTTLSAATAAAGTTESTNISDASFSAASSAAQAFDPAQNYFLIFVNGRTYTGLASATVNVLANSVVGALLGAQPSFGSQTNQTFDNLTVFVPNTTNFVVITNPAVTNTFVTNSIVVSNIGGLFVTNSVLTTNVTVTDPERITNTTVTTGDLPSAGPTKLDPIAILNRGLSGGFQAQLQNKGAYMSFAGNGQLSTPSEAQTVSLSTNATGDQVQGVHVTQTVPFLVNGLRTSFSTSLSVSSQTTGN